MKRFLKLAGLLILVVMIIVVTRTLQFQSKQLIPQSFTPLNIDTRQTARLLSEAVRFKTISWQESGRTDVAQFKLLITFLKKSFPLFHQTARREVIGDQHLLYTWQGTNPSLKPVLLMGHLDVVPVAPGTEQDWEQAPFSGTIADGFIWGRGTIDDKSTIIGLLSSAEALLKNGFRPERTLVFAFGGDEEIGGKQGAAQIAHLLKQRNIEFEFIMDEGGAITQGVVKGVDAPVALIGIAEKGYLSLKLKVNMQGGHSSMPQEQTAIGILSSGLAQLESNQMCARIEKPVQAMFDHVGPEMPFINRIAMANLWLFKPLVINRMKTVASNNAAVRTTTAITMMNSGVKENVLPASATAVVNFRILPGDSIEDVINHVRSTVDDERIKIESLSIQQPPSVVSDTTSNSFKLLNQTIRNVYPDAMVAPYLVVGATDSRHYAGLSNNIYRFMPVRMQPEDLKRFHGTNERISIENFSDMVQFYVQLLGQL